MLTLISGTSLAQIVNIGSIPILSRLYSPSDFGILGTYLAITSIAVSMSSLQYSKSIILPKEFEKALSLLSFSILCVFVFSLFSLFLAFIYNYILCPNLAAASPMPWLYWIPLSILFLGIRDVLFVWSNRLKKYKRIANSRIFAAIATAVTSISVGIIFNYSHGLLLGLLSGHLVFFGYLIFFVLTEDGLHLPKKKEIVSAVKEYKNFPKYTLPSDILNVFINQIPVFSIGLFSTQSNVGFYSMSNKVLGLPISLVGGALSEIFKQRASEEYHKIGNCARLYVKTLKNMAALSIIPFIILILFAPIIFNLSLGEEWKTAGFYSQLLAPMFLFRFFASPLSFMYHLCGKQKEELLLHIYFLLSTLLIFFLIVQNSVVIALASFSLNYVLVYSYVIKRGHEFSKPENRIHQ